MNKNKFDNIEYCINILYNFAYNRNKIDGCYMLKHIDIPSIELNKIKKQSNYNHILTDNKLKFIGINNEELVFKRYSKDSYPTTIRIGVYNKSNNNINDMQRKELVAMKLNYILSELALNNKYPFIMLPIMNFDIKLEAFKKMNLLDKSKLNDWLSQYNIDNDSILYINVQEHYFKLMTLKEYLDENINKLDTKYFKIIFFQIYYALYKILDRFPAFRHNKLDIDAIYLYKKKDIVNKYSFVVGNKTYDIPNLGFELKITNFNNSNINGIVNNKDSLLKTENQYYDLHYITQSIFFYLDNKHKINNDLKQFFDIVLPEIYRSNNIKIIGLDEPYYNKTVINILTPKLI